MAFEQRLRAHALKILYAYWQEIRRGRPAPTRADIDPARIVSVLPIISLYDVEDSPRRYRIRLTGTRNVSWYGCDLTGSYLDEIDLGGDSAAMFSFIDKVVLKEVPGHMTGEYTKQDGRTIRYERLLLPLSNDGDRVDMLLGAALRLPGGVPIASASFDD